jgi:hypothetical protein
MCGMNTGIWALSEPISSEKLNNSIRSSFYIHIFFSHAQLFSILEATCSSETSINFYRTIQRHILDDRDVNALRYFKIETLINNCNRYF